MFVEGSGGLQTTYICYYFIYCNHFVALRGSSLFQYVCTVVVYSLLHTYYAHMVLRSRYAYFYASRLNVGFSQIDISMLVGYSYYARSTAQETCTDRVAQVILIEVRY